MTAYRLRRILCTCSLLVSAAATTEAQNGTPQSDSAFVLWARRSARPLKALELPDTRDNLSDLALAIQGASIVGVGESRHSVHEFLEVRFSLVRQLVQHFGFTGVAMETGLPEARRIDAWLTGDVTTEPNFARDLSYGFGEDVETVNGLRWLHSYNATIPRPRRVHFYGVDVPANGGGSLLPTLEPVWDYLRQVDSVFGDTHRVRMESVARRLASTGWQDVPARYKSLSQLQRDTLRRGVVELATRLENRRQEYERRSSPDSYAWAARLAHVARQTESLLRSGWSPHNPRDSAMASNARWVMEREKPRGGVILLAHNLHVDAARGVGPYWSLRLKDIGYDGPIEPVDRVGQILREQLGRSYASIGMAFLTSASDSVSANSDPASIDGQLSQIGLSAFFLALRNAPSSVSPWTGAPHLMRAEGSYVEVVLARSFDAIIYIDRIRSADKTTGGALRR